MQFPTHFESHCAQQLIAFHLRVQEQLYQSSLFSQWLSRLLCLYLFYCLRFIISVMHLKFYNCFLLSLQKILLFVFNLSTPLLFSNLYLVVFSVIICIFQDNRHFSHGKSLSSKLILPLSFTLLSFTVDLIDFRFSTRGLTSFTLLRRPFEMETYYTTTLTHSVL